MRTRNVRTKKYIGNNDKFADLCNYFLFDGKQVIQPNDLKEKDVTELGLPYTDRGYMALEKVRDLLKSCVVKTAAGITYLVIGIENQTDIHYAMVIRNMLMDALNYATQVDAYAKKHRKDKDLKGDVKMRKIIINRKKSFVGCASKVYIYITKEVKDFKIYKEDCLLLGYIKNGKSLEAEILEDEVFLVAAYDNLGVFMPTDYILIPKGTDEIIVEGKTKLAPSKGNPFIFNA